MEFDKIEENMLLFFILNIFEILFLLNSIYIKQFLIVDFYLITKMDLFVNSCILNNK